MPNVTDENHVAIQKLLLEMAQQLSLDDLLSLIVQRLADFEKVALARLWLARPGDICSTCVMVDECSDRSRCLHLMASAGHSINSEEDWARTDGKFRRFPIGGRKVGRIASSGKPLEIMNTLEQKNSFVEPDWVQRERIKSFAGQPLIYRGKTLGVLAIFSRKNIREGTLPMIRMLADHAAIAICNARAFQKINQLKSQLEVENIYLKEEFYTAQSYGELIGQSPAHQKVLQQIELVAPTNASVLVLGETGTGKELIARELQRKSNRRDKPLIKVNCAAVPKELWNSEFLGHVKGAFTGAVRNRLGRLKAADGGTMFLDEVGETPMEHQSKLLRILQEGEFERVGEEKTQKVDIRFISATNRSLEKGVESGQFRKDLYYRLNVFPLEVAPLRERKEDIPLLTDYFLRLISRKMNTPIPTLTQKHLKQLLDYHWPGNIRELQNILERAMIQARSGVNGFELWGLPGHSSPPTYTANTSDKRQIEVVPEEEIVRRQRENTIAALVRTSWKVYGEDGAAKLLGIKPTTLISRIKKMGLEKPT
ncbi:MAG: GAF domain-containing protein [Deltaproteobacteria bacterium]|nr:GAF domain-containing protein [Deltaproteobacteria bacterium]